MNQITAFNDPVIQNVFTARVEKLAADIAAEFGVEVNRASNINSNATLITFNLAFKVLGAKPETHRHSEVYGTGPIKKSEIKIDFKFRFKTRTYTVRGFNYKNYKNCVSIVRDDGKRFKTSFENIMNMGMRV